MQLPWKINRMKEPKRQIRKILLWTCFILGCLGISLMLWYQPEEHGLQGLIKLVRVTFPDVNQISEHVSFSGCCTSFSATLVTRKGRDLIHRGIPKR